MGWDTKPPQFYSFAVGCGIVYIVFIVVLAFALTLVIAHFLSKVW